MISAHKSLLSLAETLTLIGWGSLFAAAAGVAAGRLDPESLRMPLLLFGLLALPLFVLAISLLQEFVQTLRGDAYDPEGENEMSCEETSMLIHWCPRLLKPTPWLVVGTLALTIWGMGFTDWNSSQPLDPRRAIGLCAFIATFYLLCQPILSSACRMPGTFATHFRSTPPS